MLQRVFAALAVTAVVGCGGSPTVTSKPPALPADLARVLAARAERVATLADQGQTCPAAREAQTLQRDTIAAVNAGQVPGALQEPLQSAANRLAAALVCAPPPVTKPEHGRGKKKGHKKPGEGDD